MKYQIICVAGNRMYEYTSSNVSGFDKAMTAFNEQILKKYKLTYPMRLDISVV